MHFVADAKATRCADKYTLYILQILYIMRCIRDRTVNCILQRNTTGSKSTKVARPAAYARRPPSVLCVMFVCSCVHVFVCVVCVVFDACACHTLVRFKLIAVFSGAVQMNKCMLHMHARIDGIHF